jgi:BMFP domain-containing protein YqiC
MAMEEKDFQRIEQLIGKVVKAEAGEAVKTQVEKTVKAELGSFWAEIDTKPGKFREDLRREISEDFRRHVGILAEDFSHKLQLVAEGRQMLSEKLDRVEGRLEEKIDSLSADLAAHRTDTEGHKRGYMVKEP